MPYIDDSAGERMARFREKQRQAGKSELRVWATPQQAAAIRAYLAGQGDALRLALDAPKTSAPANPPSPPQAPPAAAGAPRSGVYPKALIDFPEKPSAGLRERLKAAGLVFLANHGAGHVWNGQRIEAGRFDPLVPAIRQECGIILDPPGF